MAKPKKYISTKLKRKFAVGGPYKDIESEMYNPDADRTVYQATDQPSTILQQQQEALNQQQAAANRSMYQSQVNAELAKNQAQQQQTANLLEEEKATRKAEEDKQKQALATQATKGAATLGKQAAKDFIKNKAANAITNTALQSGSYYSPTWASTTPMPAVPTSYGTPMLVDPAMQTVTSTTGELFAGAPTVGQNLATTSTTGANVALKGANTAVTGTDVAGKAATGASLGTAGASIGLGLLGEGVGLLGTYKQRQADDAAKRSQYYRDANYTNREAFTQIGKSTLKGAGMGIGIGAAAGAGIGAVPAALIGGAAGLAYGTGKALHEKRLTKAENERGIKIGDKRFGKKLLFGDENVYSASKDPYEIAKLQYQENLERQSQLASAMDTAALASRTTEANSGFNVKGGNMAKYGGKIEYLKGGIAKSLPRGAKEYVGKKHEQGGIDLPGNIEVEGGETEQNNYIFSATLKLPTGITYAQAHKNLLASGASSEEIKQLALSQEAVAGRNPNEIKTMKFAKYGGPIMYVNGGPKDSDKKEPDIVVSGRTKQYWQDLECVRDPKSCSSSKRIKELKEKYGPDAYLTSYENYKLKNAALSGDIPSWFLEDRKKADYYNRYKQRFDPYRSDPYPYLGLYPESQQYLERPFTDAEVAYYLGQKDNPDSTIPNPANGTTLPNPELFTEDIYGQGPAVEFNTRVPAGEFSAEAAKNLPAKTNKAKQAFNKLQNTLKEKAAQRAEDNKVYNAPELPEVVITGSNPQQDVLNLIQGKDISRIAGPNSNLKLATYNLPELTNPTVSTFVPDEVVSQAEDNKMYAGKNLPEVVINAIRPKATTQVVNNTVPETVTTKKDPTEGMTRDERLEYYRKQRNLPEGTVMLPPAIAMSKAQKDMLLNEDKELVTPSLNVEPPVESDKNVSTENNKKSTIDLPPPPTYTRTKSTNNLGLIQTIPAAIALTNNIKTRSITPSLTTNYVQPGSIGQINLGRVSMSAEKAANQQNQAAITQALQNMSGPGAIAGMVAAKTKADQQALQIAQAEQNINMGRAGEEAKINAGISQFNVGQSMAAQQARANIDQANAARMQQAMQFNTQLKYARDVENREQRLAAADRAAQAITMNALANRQLDVTENLANVQDYTDAYKRYLEQMDKQEAKQRKFGGAKKYISRLGDLKNVKYKV